MPCGNYIVWDLPTGPHGGLSRGLVGGLQPACHHVSSGTRERQACKRCGNLNRGCQRTRGKIQKKIAKKEDMMIVLAVTQLDLVGDRDKLMLPKKKKKKERKKERKKEKH